MWRHMGFGGLFVDNFSAPVEETAPKQRKARDPVARGKVDWGAPLQSSWEYKKGGGGKKRAAAASPPGVDAAAGGGARLEPGALPPSQAALRLTMRLVEGSQEVGILDVTAAAAQLLLEHRGSLQPAQLARLAARMAEAGMNSDVQLLVDSGVTSGSHNGQAVGWVAAALTGGWRATAWRSGVLGAGSAACSSHCLALVQPSSSTSPAPGPPSLPLSRPPGDLGKLQSALQASGTVALAALQANTYRLPQSLSTTNAWNDALKAGSVAGGAQAHLTIMPAGL
jgi:hypothetical protein